MIGVRKVLFVAEWMLFMLLVVARSDPNVTLLDKACEGGEHKSKEKYVVSVGYVLEDLSRSTPEQGFNYDCKHEYLGVWSRGHGACYGGLSKGDCARCMVKVKEMALRICANKIHGYVQLQDCQIMYDKSTPK